MAKLVAVTACPTGIAHTFMAAEALRRAALAAGHDIRVETQGSVGTADALTPSEIAAADAVILATDVRVDEARFAGKPVVQTSTQDAIRNAAGLVAQATAALGAAAPAAAPVSDGKKYIVGITSCPTGIAHTFMAAEGLEGGAKSLGYDVKIETQGSVGAGNALSDDDVRRADVPVYGSGSAASSGDYVADAAAAKAAKNAGVPSFYKHLMTGVSHMLPFVVAGGLLIALGFAFGSFQFGDQGIFIYEDKYAGTIGNLLFNIGANGAFKLFVPVLAGYIAFSIADRPGLAPGMVGGLIAANTGSGFLGGMVAGFIAGYFVRWLNRALKLPRTLEGLKPTLLLPLLGTLVVGLLMLTVVGKPVAAALTAVTNWLQGLGQGSAGLLGALLGGMMAFDMGGPINKAAYTFSTGLLTNKVYGPIAATMAAGMTPPLALFFATQLFKNRFTKDEQEAGKAAGVLGISFITEGAIPFAARDPLRVIPALMAGSAVAGFISMATGCLLRAPHGGIFVLFIPNAVTNLPMYIVAIVAGTAVSTLLLGLLKKPLAVTPVPSGEGTL